MDWGRAVSLLDRARQLDPDETDFVVPHAVALCLGGRRDDGLDLLAWASRRAPADRRLGHALAVMAWHALGPADRTTLAWRRCVALWAGLLHDPGFWEAYRAGAAARYGTPVTDNELGALRADLLTRLEARMPEADPVVRPSPEIVLERESEAARLLAEAGGLSWTGAAGTVVCGPLRIVELGREAELGAFVAAAGEAAAELRQAFSHLGFAHALLRLDRPAEALAALSGLRCPSCRARGVPSDHARRSGDQHERDGAGVAGARGDAVGGGTPRPPVLRPTDLPEHTTAPAHEPGPPPPATPPTAPGPATPATPPTPSGPAAPANSRTPSGPAAPPAPVTPSSPPTSPGPLAPSSPPTSPGPLAPSSPPTSPSPSASPAPAAPVGPPASPNPPPGPPAPLPASGPPPGPPVPPSSPGAAARPSPSAASSQAAPPARPVRAAASGRSAASTGRVQPAESARSRRAAVCDPGCPHFDGRNPAYAGLPDKRERLLGDGRSVALAARLARGRAALSPTGPDIPTAALSWRRALAHAEALGKRPEVEAVVADTALAAARTLHRAGDMQGSGATLEAAWTLLGENGHDRLKGQLARVLTDRAIAQANRARERMETPAADLRRAVALNPHLPRAQLNLGVALHILGAQMRWSGSLAGAVRSWQEAADRLTAALVHFPGDPELTALRDLVRRDLALVHSELEQGRIGGLPE
ncbi:hypothetical protein [Streptomyces sp. NPDC101249]|uniref:hypothetical protein n=1 Tax=Streptomyces sp. NPDC101249 TaxID=3366140 RepID=UPI0037FBDD03